MANSWPCASWILGSRWAAKVASGVASARREKHATRGPRGADATPLPWKPRPLTRVNRKLAGLIRVSSCTCLTRRSCLTRIDPSYLAFVEMNNALVTTTEGIMRTLLGALLFLGLVAPLGLELSNHAPAQGDKDKKP